MAVRIRNTARGDFGVEPPVALLLQGASLQDLTADLIGQLGLGGQDTAEQRERTSRSGPAACRSAPTSRNAAKGRTTSMTSSTSNSLPPNAVAVVGMAGRFPGAESVSAFWRNLRRDEESIVTLSEDDLMAAGVGEKALANHAYIRRAALVDGIDEFDADFFGFTPQAARMMDPQHRLFLQCAWHALEDAGYDPAQIEGSIGVYGTSSTSGYLLHNLMSHLDPNAIIGQGATFEMINLSLQNDKDHLATRVAHQFNLRGPALSVQTACSSSLVAVHLACQSILNGECDMALAGGASHSGPAPRRVLARTRIDGVGERPLPAVRCEGGRHHLRQRSRCCGAQATAGRSRRRGPHSRRHQGIGDQQRRIDEDELRGAQRCRSGRGHR